MRERDDLGIRNAARFAIQPNMWGFCGEDSSQEILREFVAERGSNAKLVRETLHDHGFPHLNAFLEAIANDSEMDPFDNQVVMSYWIGTYLTEKVGTETKEKLVKSYGEKISKEFAVALAEKLPEQIYLTHLSQVALIAAEGYEQSEKTKLINHCMVAYGTIVAVDMEKREATVKRDVLKKKENAGYEVVQGKQTVKIDVDLTSKLNIGDDIAVHLGYLAAKLRSDQAEKLRYWTRKVAALI
jgi:hydrogenase maturation factor